MSKRTSKQKQRRREKRAERRQEAKEIVRVSPVKQANAASFQRLLLGFGPIAG